MDLWLQAEMSSFKAQCLFKIVLWHLIPFTWTITINIQINTIIIWSPLCNPLLSFFFEWINTPRPRPPTSLIPSPSLPHGSTTRLKLRNQRKLMKLIIIINIFTYCCVLLTFVSCEFKSSKSGISTNECDRRWPCWIHYIKNQ